jgi:hypothetical protein
LLESVPQRRPQAEMNHPLPHTPDGRYFIVEGRAGPRLWRATNPALSREVRAQLTRELMDARRAIKHARGDTEATRAARVRVDRAKQALGERGPVWWADGAPDFNRRLVRNSPYADWWSERPASTT